jgi:hypothetical protein
MPVFRYQLTHGLASGEKEKRNSRELNGRVRQTILGQISSISALLNEPFHGTLKWLSDHGAGHVENISSRNTYPPCGYEFALIKGQKSESNIAGITPTQVRWFTPTYYTDGRERAQLYGDSSQNGPWVDRVKIPAGKHVAAHTHPRDELVTVIEGTWYVGAGNKYEPAKLQGYPAGSFVLIPAGLPHFVATRETAVIVQLSGTERFRTDSLEK